MKEANVRFEFDGFDVIADGEVVSEGCVEEVSLTFVGVNEKEVDRNTMKMAKELARELLADSVYCGDLEF